MLEYIDGPAFDQNIGTPDLLHYVYVPSKDFNKVAIEGTVNLQSWLGIHTLRIKSTLGSYNSSPTAKGVNGMYKSVNSKEVKLTILEPCRNSTVNGDLGLNITNMAVPEGKNKLMDVYLGPKNSISVIYGNGYDRCGPLKYSFLSLDGKQFNLDVFS